MKNHKTWTIVVVPNTNEVKLVVQSMDTRISTVIEYLEERTTSQGNEPRPESSLYLPKVSTPITVGIIMNIAECKQFTESVKKHGSLKDWILNSIMEFFFPKEDHALAAIMVRVLARKTNKKSLSY